MTLSTVQQTLDRYYAALQSGDANALADVLTSDITVDYPGPAGLLPWIGQWNGIDGFRAFLTAVSDHVTIDHVEQRDVILTDEKAIVHLAGRWTAKKTGKSITAEAINIFTIKDGKVARYQVFNDTAAFAAGLSD